jgi:hypothetical protein
MNLLKSMLISLISVILTICVLDQVSPLIRHYYHPDMRPEGTLSTHHIRNRSALVGVAFDWSKVPQKPGPGDQDEPDTGDKDYAHMFGSSTSIFKGSCLLPNTSRHVHLTRISTGEVLFDGTYSSDPKGRRLTLPQVKRAKQTLLLDGCSCTFGDAVSDPETVASYAQQRLSDLRVLNLGYPGRSPASSFYFHQDPASEVLNDVHGGTGIVAYIFADFHMSRILVDSNWMMYPFNDEPVYRTDNGKLAFKGMTSEYYSGLRGLLFWAYTKSKFYREFRIELPTHSYQEKIELASELIAADLNTLAKRFDQARRILIIHPYSTEYNADIKTNLEHRGVTVLDYSQYDFPALLNGYDVTREGHTSALYNELLGALIARDLKRMIK